MGAVMPTVDVNGTQLYYERKGAGAPLLLIMGATGDGGVFDRFADPLADEFTVVTYDRRGNGRSPRPQGWETTSPEEQAADAAALLDALGLAPAAVFGTSSGGIFALAMLIRHPRAVRAALLHEPALFTLFDDPEEARSRVTEAVTAGMEAGGPPAALDSIIRLVAGDANWEQLNPTVRERMLASAGTYFGTEIGKFDTYLPDDDTLASTAAPVRLLVGDDSLPYFAQAAGRLAARLHVDVTRVPGTHFGYLDHPAQLAQTVSALLRNGGRRPARQSGPRLRPSKPRDVCGSGRDGGLRAPPPLRGPPRGW
jgi:pimeloyl-ACP methyl ester carboxylesterase